MLDVGSGLAVRKGCKSLLGVCPKILNCKGTWPVGWEQTPTSYLPHTGYRSPPNPAWCMCEFQQSHQNKLFYLGNLAMINWNNIVSDIVVGANNIYYCIWHSCQCQYFSGSCWWQLNAPSRIHVNNVQYTQTHDCNNGTDIIISANKLKLNANWNWTADNTIDDLARVLTLILLIK